MTDKAPIQMSRAELLEYIEKDLYEEIDMAEDYRECATWLAENLPWPDYCRRAEAQRRWPFLFEEPTGDKA